MGAQRQRGECTLRHRSIQTKSEIEAMLSEAGARPRRRHGQNFLIDGNLMRQLLAAADAGPDDVVLEVGPGTGALTEQLAPVVHTLIAVEIDKALHAIVERRLAGVGNLTLIHGDALSSKHEIASAVVRALLRARREASGRMMLVANLPYNVATPLLINLLLEPCGFERFCFTIQREVGDRFTASPGTKAYGPVSIAMQSTSDIRRLAILPPDVFWPRPEVESSMFVVDVQRNPFETHEGLGRFFELVRAGFAHRRKTLKHNLTRAVGAPRCQDLSYTIDLSRRAESLTVDEWIELARRLV